MTALTTTTDALPVTMGFSTMAAFEFLERSASIFANSTMVPTAYQAVITKGYGRNAKTEHNPAAMANCMIALDMAQRMSANPLQVMQNLHVIEGRPSWSSQFIIAAINSCGRFSPLRFDVEPLGEMDANYSTYEWDDGRKVEQKQTVRIQNMRCVAWATEKGTGQRLESAPVTLEMAVNEGWFTKNGSKWRSMPDLMLRYRSAAFFGRIYAPELLMGLPTAEEVQDVVTVDDAGNVVSVAQQAVSPTTGNVDSETGEITPTKFYAQAGFEKNLPAWADLIASGKKPMERVIATIESKAPLSPEQKKALADAVKARQTSAAQDVTEKGKPAAEPAPAAATDSATPPATAADGTADDTLPWDDIDVPALDKRLREAKDLDALYVVANEIEAAPAEAKDGLNTTFNARLDELQG